MKNDDCATYSARARARGPDPTVSSSCQCSVQDGTEETAQDSSRRAGAVDQGVGR